MVDRDVDNPGQLYRMLEGYGPKEKESVSRNTVYAYFSNAQTPQPWFVRAVSNVLELDDEQTQRLYDAYFKSY